MCKVSRCNSTKLEAIQARHHTQHATTYNSAKLEQTHVSAFWEWGSPDLPACGPRRGSKGGPAWPIFINTDPRPSRGAKPRGGDDTELPQARPHQAGSRGGGEIKAGYLTRCRDTSHDDQRRQAGASRAVSSFPLWCKGSKRSRGVPRHQAKVAISVQQDQDQDDCKTASPRRRHHQSFVQAKTTFVRIASTSCPPSN